VEESTVAPAWQTEASASPIRRQHCRRGQAGLSFLADVDLEARLEDD